MQKIIFILFISISTLTNAQTIPPDSAKYHIGELITVCGIVSETHTSVTYTNYINFGKPYPNNSFTAIIIAKDTANFQGNIPVQILTNKKICVTGKIKLYKEKPEMFLNLKEQLEVLPVMSLTLN